MKVGVTGGRPKTLGLPYDIYSHQWFDVSQWFRRCYEDIEPTRVVAGGALGVDWLATSMALNMGIPVTIAMPFPGYSNSWPNSQKSALDRLLTKCNHLYVCGQPGYEPWKFHKRNEYIVDNVDVLLAGPGGRGTQGTIDYAEDRITVVKYA